MKKLLRAGRELEEKLGRVPTNDEISRLMDLPVETVQKLKTISREPVSLETPVGRDGESALGDLIEDRNWRWRRRATCEGRNHILLTEATLLADRTNHAAVFIMRSSKVLPY